MKAQGVFIFRSGCLHIQIRVSSFPQDLVDGVVAHQWAGSQLGVGVPRGSQLYRPPPPPVLAIFR